MRTSACRGPTGFNAVSALSAVAGTRRAPMSRGLLKNIGTSTSDSKEVGYLTAMERNGAMPKERIYDSFSPDETGIELGWDKGTGEVLIGAARLDEDGKAAALAPPGTQVPVMLGLSGIERLQKTLDRIKRQAVCELKTVRAVAVLDAVDPKGEIQERAFRAEAIQQALVGLMASAEGMRPDSSPSFRTYRVDTDGLDGKSLWQQNKTAYIVEMDYIVTE